MNDDTYALLAWLRGKELEAHNEVNRKQIITNKSPAALLPAYEIGISIGMEKAFREVITKIENNPKELHRELIPAGWVEIYCCPPDWLTKSGFKCSSALPMQPGDITNKCGASDADLMTEEEWEAQQMEEKMRMNRDDREMKGLDGEK